MNDPIDNRTVIKDIDIPFGRLVAIMLKFMLAAIPAMILFYMLCFGLILLFAVLFGGGAALLNGIMHH